MLHLVYYYDKGLYLGAACETAAVACELGRRDGDIDNLLVVDYFKKTIDKKPLYFVDYKVDVMEDTFGNIYVSAMAKRRKLKIEVKGCMPNTKPERALRYKKRYLEEEDNDGDNMPEGSKGAHSEDSER